jgi:hypothetical protein
VILADTSAWVEYLRGTGSEQNARVRELLAGGELATTDAVLMELLAGARDADHRERLRSLMARGRYVSVEGPLDYERAAAVHRACRRQGDTVRSLVDCLIAAVAIRAELPLLHADADFETIARHTPLALA